MMDSNTLFDNYLQRLSESVAPNEAVYKHGNKIMDEIFRVLQNPSQYTHNRNAKGYSIARCSPVGGKEKKTSTDISLDFDLTIFVNGERPPFDNLLDAWEDILLLHFDELNHENMKKTAHSLQFSIQGIEFDVLPGANMVKGSSMVKAQVHNTLQVISSSGDIRQQQKQAKLYSSSLSEAAVEFMKNTSPFVHKAARLAKFWNNSIFFTLYVSGRSSIIELLAVACAKHEEDSYQGKGPSHLNAFRKFLNKFVNYQSINVKYFDYYKESDVLSDVIKQRPLLLDPSSPYNNYLYDQEEFLKFFSKCASETLQRLAKAENSLRCYHDPELEKLFEPQPLICSIQQSYHLAPKITLIGVSPNSRKLMPAKVIRNTRLPPPVISTLLKVFAVVVDLVLNKRQEDKRSMTDVKESVKGFVDKSLLNGCRREWVSTADKHEDCDVTFIIPYLDDDKNALKVSFDW